MFLKGLLQDEHFETIASKIELEHFYLFDPVEPKM